MKVCLKSRRPLEIGGLECPICMTIFSRGGILQCENGHSFCKACWPDDKACALCGAQGKRIRNRSLEQVMESSWECGDCAETIEDLYSSELHGCVCVGLKKNAIQTGVSAGLEEYNPSHKLYRKLDFLLNEMPVGWDMFTSLIIVNKKIKCEFTTNWPGKFRWEIACPCRAGVDDESLWLSSIGVGATDGWDLTFKCKCVKDAKGPWEVLRIPCKRGPLVDRWGGLPFWHIGDSFTIHPNGNFTSSIADTTLAQVVKEVKEQFFKRRVIVID